MTSLQRKGKSLSYLAAASILLIPALAFAQEVAEPTSIERFTTELMNVLVPVFVAFIGGLATWTLNLFRKKTGIAVADEHIIAWSALARKAALRGAEWSRKKAKESAEGKKVPGPEVLEVAANFAIDMALQAKLPAMGRERLEALIEAELFDLRREEKSTDPSLPKV